MRRVPPPDRRGSGLRACPMPICASRANRCSTTARSRSTARPLGLCCNWRACCSRSSRAYRAEQDGLAAVMCLQMRPAPTPLGAGDGVVLHVDHERAPGEDAARLRLLRDRCGQRATGVLERLPRDPASVGAAADRLRPAAIQTCDDHRMARSFAVLGLRTPGITLCDPECAASTVPDFARRLRLPAETA